jgi:hypothetical protein
LSAEKIPSHSRPAKLRGYLEKEKDRIKEQEANSETWRADGSEVEDELTHEKDGAHASGG